MEWIGCSNGRGNATGYPIVALYNPVSKNLINLSPELYSYKPWVVVSSVAGAGNFMIAYATPSTTRTGYSTGMLEYLNGKFINLTSTLPNSDFIPSGMAYNGASYLIVGYYPSNTTNGVASAALFSYTPQSGLINLTSYIPLIIYTLKYIT